MDYLVNTVVLADHLNKTYILILNSKFRILVRILM